MAVRPNKTASSQNQFSLAPTPLRIADLDADFNEIFANIDNTNIKAGAGINTTKLATDAGIVTGMLADNAVTAVKIAALAVTTGKLADLGVTTAKIAVAASTPNLVAGASAGVTISNNTETTIMTATAIPSPRNGANLIIFGTMAGIINLDAAALNVTITVNLYKNLTPTLLRSYAVGTITPVAATRIPYMWPILDFDVSDGAIRVYTVKVQLGGTLGTSTFFASNTSRVAAVELA